MGRFLCKKSSDLPLYRFQGSPLWTEEELTEKLSSIGNRSFTIKFTNNRSTYLRLMEKKRRGISLSLQRFFLYAPEEVCQSLVDYILKRRVVDGKRVNHFAKAYYQQEDISDEYEQKNLWHKGDHYDLKEILDRVNLQFFQQRLTGLSICYFPKPHYKKCRSITWGVYDRPARLIRLNHMLDQETTPEYFIEYIVYHEMLHHVCLPQQSSIGKTIYHTAEFRKLEKAFPYYHEAKQWEKEFFKIHQNRMRKNYGWS